MDIELSNIADSFMFELAKLILQKKATYTMKILKNGNLGEF